MPGSYLNFPFDDELFLMRWRAAQDPTMTAMFESGAVVSDAEIARMISNGSNMYTVPFYNVLAGNDDNYNGEDNISVDAHSGASQSGVVYGRAHAWKAQDFVYDFNSGADPMGSIVSQIDKYWQKKRQNRMIGLVDSLFNIADDGSAMMASWKKHNISIAATSGTPTEVNKFGATTAGDAMQAAVGDNAGIFTMAWMHSKVATNLAGLQLLTFRKYTDPAGIERQLAIGDINGRTVIVDDGCPVAQNILAAGTYTLTVSTPAAAGDKIKLFGVEYEFVANSASDTGNKIKVGATPSAAEQATNIATKLGALTEGEAANYTYSASSAVVTITGKTGIGMYAAPSYAKVSGTIVAALATATAPTLVNEYSTYLFGMGALRYAKAPVKVPVEHGRERLAGGGYDYVVTRLRETIHPNGFSYTLGAGVVSPTDAQLAGNWSLCGIDPKAIPIAKIVSNG